MRVTLAPSTWLKDKTGKVFGEPGQTVTVTEQEGEALLRTGSAVPADEAPAPGARTEPTRQTR